MNSLESSLVIWLDASNPDGQSWTADVDTTHSTWIDLSGNNNNAVANTATTLHQNGLYFNGSNYFTISAESWIYNSQDNASDSEAQAIYAYDIFIVMKPQDNGDSWAGVFGRGGGRNFNFWLNTNEYIHHKFYSNISSNDGTDSASGTIPFNSTHIVNYNNSGSVATSYINGEQASSYSSHSSLTTNTNPINIGRNLDLTDTTTITAAYQGHIAEIIVFDTILTDAQRAYINYYLSKKWDLETTVDSDSDGISDYLETNQHSTSPVDAEDSPN